MALHEVWCSEAVVVVSRETTLLDVGREPGERHVPSDGGPGYPIQGPGLAVREPLGVPDAELQLLPTAGVGGLLDRRDSATEATMPVQQFPVRWNHQTDLPRRGDGVRAFVNGAKALTLELDPLVLEILAVVSGKFLTGIQRRVLASVAHEYIADRSPTPLGVGGLSQADVFGAVFGVVQFALTNKSDWLFVRIPEGDEQSPDIFALANRGSRPWNLEMKAVAPGSGELEVGWRLDTCARVMAQRRKGIEQLDHRVLSLPAGPVVGVTQGGGGQATPATHFRLASGGRALCITILPHACLVDRTDLLPAAVGLCGNRCVATCLSGKHMKSACSIVGLLWQEPDSGASTASQGPNAKDSDPTGTQSDLLAGVAAGNAAVWAGVDRIADDALCALVEATLRLGPRFQGEFLVERVLRGYWRALTTQARATAVTRLRTQAGRPLENDAALQREIERPELPRRTRRSAKTLEIAEDGMPAADVEHDLSGVGIDGIGAWSGEDFRVAPTRGFVERAMKDGRPAMLLDAATNTLALVAELGFKKLGRPFQPHFQDVAASCGENKFVVGRRLLFDDDSKEAWASFDGRVQFRFRRPEQAG